MRLQDIMTTEVETVSPDESAENAWNRMEFQEIHHLVVQQNADVVGILSHRDLGGKHGEAIRRNRSVSDLMTPKPVTAEPRTTIHDAANLFRGNSIGCVPIVQNGSLVGIVTLSDLLELIGKGLDRSALKKERRTVLGIPFYQRPGHPPIT